MILAGLRKGKYMKLIDADELKYCHITKAVISPMGCAMTKIINSENIPTAYDVDKIEERLQTELSLADKEKECCARENPLQFDEAKGYAHGISVALEIVKSGFLMSDKEK